MADKLYLSTADVVRLDMRKIIVQPKSTRVVVYFAHCMLPNCVAFTTTMSFHARDSRDWFTSFHLIEGENVSGVSLNLRRKIEGQMKVIFSPYFDMMMEGKRPW